MFFLEHFLLSLSNALLLIHREQLIFLFPQLGLLNMSVPLLIHFFAEFEIFNQLTLRLPIFLHLPLQSSLALFFLSDTIESFFLVIFDFSGPPLAKLIFALQPLFMGEFTSAFGGR